MQEKDLELVQSLVDKINWKSTLTTWAKLTEFKGILFPPLYELMEKHAEDISKIVLDEKNYNLSETNVDNKGNIATVINHMLDKQTDLGSSTLNHENLPSISEPKNEYQECKTDTLNEKNLIKPLSTRKESPKRRNSSSSDDSYYSVEEAEFDCDNPIKNSTCHEKLFQTSVDTKETFDNSEVI